MSSWWETAHGEKDTRPAIPEKMQNNNCRRKCVVGAEKTGQRGLPFKGSQEAVLDSELRAGAGAGAGGVGAG